MDKTSQLFSKIILIVVLAVAIVYVNKIPSKYINFFYNTPGRLSLIVIVLMTYEWLGLAPALLVTLLSLLLIAGGIKTYEGFDDIVQGKKESFSSDIDIIDNKHNVKWWDEQLLGRESIVTNKTVNTIAAQ